MSDVRLTQQVLEVFALADADMRTTQVVLEAFALVGADLRLTQQALEAWVSTPTPSATVASGALRAFLQLRTSGVSVVNAVGRVPLGVSAEWVVFSGVSGFSYTWTLHTGVQLIGVSAITP